MERALTMVTGTLTLKTFTVPLVEIERIVKSKSYDFLPVAATGVRFSRHLEGRKESLYGFNLITFSLPSFDLSSSA